MIVYRGSSKSNFTIQKHKPSRYGFSALFFSSDLSLAKLYAHHRAKQESLKRGGFVYEFEIGGLIEKVDFGGKLSYSGEFRLLMYHLYYERHKSVQITNVIDYPSAELIHSDLCDVIVVFDFEIIKSMTLIQRNVLIF